MKTGLFIVVSIDILLICWALRDLLLWHLKINEEIAILEKMLRVFLRILIFFKKNNKLQKYNLKEAFTQEKIKIYVKRRMNKSETPSLRMAETENYTQQVGIYQQMKK